MSYKNAFCLKQTFSEIEYNDFIRRITKISKYMGIAIFPEDRTSLSDYEYSVEFMNYMDEFKVYDEIVSKWPGTETLEPRTRYIKYRITDDNIDRIIEFKNSLEEWSYPSYIEDFSFHNEDDELLFYATSHEEDYWLFIDDKKILSIGDWIDYSKRFRSH